MKKSTIIGIVIAVALVIVGIWSISGYNNFVTLDQEVEQQWAQVQVQYQRRMDLIPNLVNTVQGYAAHESNTFEAVTRARAGLSEAMERASADTLPATGADQQDLNRFNSAQQDLGRALNIYVNAVHEAYPTLQANAQFADLQAQLEGTENRIATERGRYTEAVRNFNTVVRKFPGNIIASLFGFSVKPQFEADSRAAQAPTVQFPQ